MSRADRALLTDLYEVTMAASYFSQGMNQPATFDLFVRALPPSRNFLVVSGLEDALTYLEQLQFDSHDISYLRSLGIFNHRFLAQLENLRFTGEVWAIPEGEVAFAGEPLLRVTAALIEAQIVETYLLNTIAFQTMIASKAARITLACEGRPYVDFSGRRDHGADAALKVARAAYIGGAAATSNLLAGREYGLPVNGTMAHSYVLSFEDEADAFRAYARDFPDGATFLIDTYDTERGARIAAKVARELKPERIRVRAVRIDSGDLTQLSKKVRAILDKAGLGDVQVFASGDLDEYRIREALAAGAPIDGFGVGTQLGTSGDAPSLGAVYKLVQDARGPKMKRSPGKVTLPGHKQVFRLEGESTATHDVIALADETLPYGARPLLERVMAGGRRLGKPESLEAMRHRRERAVMWLPAPLRSLSKQAEYEVRISDRLQQLVDATHWPGN